jgi:hypothetical protein
MATEYSTRRGALPAPSSLGYWVIFKLIHYRLLGHWVIFKLIHYPLLGHWISLRSKQNAEGVR